MIEAGKRANYLHEIRQENNAGLDLKDSHIREHFSSSTQRVTLESQLFVEKGFAACVSYLLTIQ